MENEQLVENARIVGDYLMKELNNFKEEELKSKGSSHIVEVRGQGLMIGIELDVPYKEIRTRLVKEQHCFTGCSGTNVIRLLPPLCLTKANVDDFIERFKKVL